MDLNIYHVAKSKHNNDKIREEVYTFKLTYSSFTIKTSFPTLLQFLSSFANNPISQKWPKLINSSTFPSNSKTPSSNPVSTHHTSIN